MATWGVAGTGGAAAPSRVFVGRFGKCRGACDCGATVVGSGLSFCSDSRGDCLFHCKPVPPVFALASNLDSMGKPHHGWNKLERECLKGLPDSSFAILCRQFDFAIKLYCASRCTGDDCERTDGQPRPSNIWSSLEVLQGSCLAMGDRICSPRTVLEAVIEALWPQAFSERR